MKTKTPAAGNSESQTLDQFGLRWSLLNAWREELAERGIALDAGARKRLDSARLKIASGCYSSCEVGCDLALVEGALVASGASVDPEAVDSWVERLGSVMIDPAEARKLPNAQPITARYVDCGYRPCTCPV